MVKNEIKVFARLKPEARRKNSVNYQIYCRPKKHMDEDYLVLNGAQKSINEFHKIFNASVHQDEVFENVAQPVIQSVLNGYNATIFAYGQTGSGKTFSITGDPERYEDRGVLPRTIQYLFETIKKNPDNLYSVEIAYLEIYNENGYDLLDPRHEVVTKLEDLPRVTIQEDETGTLHLKNLSFRNVENENDALALLFLGDTNRAISETPMNPQSSRSHCIFTIVVSVKQSGAQHLSKAKMHLVDLAGSERVYKCCISGSILTEAKHINLSLHYLEQVIVCLGQQNVSHIPYRNSLLTAILRDSLGGNCLTTMLATLSMNVSNLEETISTCRFSQRVALIKNDVNLVLESNPVDENRFLKMEIERLKNELAQLTKRPVTSGELTAKEKQDLNIQVNKFLESDETIIDWQKDDRKIKYCLQVLRENFKIRNGVKLGLDDTEKDLNYYRNLVVQRDKEISALINMLKKTGKNALNNTSDFSEFPESHENRNKSIPKMSIVAKKLRLRDVMVEARSIAELIKSGKASIGDLRTRMMDNPVEIQTLEENLQKEQSRLARNLSRLKNLKSEATGLKTELLIEETGCPANFLADSTRRSVDSSQKSSAPLTERNQTKFNVGDSEKGKKLTMSSLTLTSPKLNRKVDDHEPRNNGASKEGRNLKIPLNKMDQENADDRGGDCLPSSRNSYYFEAPSPVSRIIEPNVESVAPRSGDSKTVDLRKAFDAGDSERNSPVGESFLRTKPSSGRESRRSSTRAPAFLRDMLRSDGFSGPGCKSLMSEKTDDSTHTVAENPGVNPSTSEPSIFSNSVINSSSSDSANVLRGQEASTGSEDDRKILVDDVTSSGYEPSCEKSGELNERSIAGDKCVEEESTKTGGGMKEPIFISDENFEPNTFVKDHSTIGEEDSFIKSLPLTGDPEIDEEIIAFYRAKRSGGIY